MSGLTSKFDIPYPTTTDKLGPNLVQAGASRTDAVLSGLCATGMCAMLSQKSGGYTFQTSDHFVNDYDASLTVNVYHTETNKTPLTPYTNSGLIKIPMGYTVLLFGSVEFLGYPAEGTFAVGFGWSANSVATTVLNEVGGGLMYVDAKGRNIAYAIPPVLFTCRSNSCFMGMCGRSQQTPTTATYRFGAIVLSTGAI